jgi:hypothetical protein
LPEQAFREALRNDIFDVLAQEFVPPVSELLFRLKIQEDDFSSRVYDDHRVRSCFQQASVSCFHLDNVFFGRFAHGNIAADDGSAHNSFHGVPDGRGSDFDIKFFPIPSFAKGLEMIDDFISR